MQVENLSGPEMQAKDAGKAAPDSAIDAAITLRLVAFYRHLVDNGSIKPLPTEGPSVD